MQNYRWSLALQDNIVFPGLVQVHIDGKIRKSWGEKHDFLAVCVTGEGMEKEKILGDIPMPRGTGLNMAEAAFKLLLDWGLVKKVLAIGFDTTTSNTGRERGTI